MGNIAAYLPRLMSLIEIWALWSRQMGGYGSSIWLSILKFEPRLDSAIFEAISSYLRRCNNSQNLHNSLHRREIGKPVVDSLGGGGGS
jgi:hypothetical protein